MNVKELLTMRNSLEKLMNLEHLTKDEIKRATNYCFTDKVTDTEIAAFLTALRLKGETPEEIAGIVHVIREQSDMSGIALTNVMDNCGTGGDRSNSFNISTTAAFVLAGAGVNIAKHGNRSVSSRAGSADVLEALGVSLTMSKQETADIIQENNIAFLYAPHVHAKLRPFMKIRQELGLPTIFNLIGPLTNPIQLDSQLVGVYDRNKLTTIGEALITLGRKRALVLNGAGQMDEASLAGENHFVLVENGELKAFTIHPEEVGLPTYDNEAIRGGNAQDNAKILLSVLHNEPGAYLDTVLFNTALGLFANGKARDVKEGIEIARESIASGKALARLNYLIRVSEEKKSSIV